ncbi:hypothetical protein [Lactobacillus sp. ESL0681]|uniref:hypothetical protein n=1 Tax=Lactobacillus sp. ESL0681 TaxID=2983211 RepID=UPI0023F7F8E0|nr:hypothetical protein [Lactobacillus sp. ESL0681]WEV41330.1 hypothetical protein OZX59_09380 [Lactobacillus sp. ESL0681]
MKEKVTNVEVIFTKLPKHGKKFFSKGLLLKKAVDITAADQSIKNYARSMENGSSSQISFEIDSDDESLIFETEIKPEDANQGIIGLIRRDTDDEELDDEDLTQIEEIISLIQDELIDFEDDSTDVKEFEKEEDEVERKDFDDKDYSTEANLESSTSKNRTDKEAATDENSEADIREDKTKVASIAPLPDETKSALVNQIGQSSTFTNIEETNGPELVSYTDFTDPKDIYDRIPANYGVNEFAVENIKHDLGYKDNPSNKYDEELNAFINSCLQDYGVKNIQSGYDEQLAKLKAEILDKLGKKYYELSPTDLSKEVREAVTPKWQELEEAANKQKDSNFAEAERRKKDEQLRQEKIDEAKLADYKQKLAAQREAELNAFNEKEDATNAERTKQIEQKLSADKEQSKHTKRLELIKKYNQTLHDKRSELGNKFNLAVRENYDQHNAAFTKGLQELVPTVSKKKIELQNRESTDRIEAQKRQADIIRQRQKDEELRLKKRELDQRQHYEDLNAKAIKELPDAIRSALVGQTRPINVEVNQKANEENKSANKDLVIGELVEATPDKTHELVQSDQVIDDGKTTHKRKKYVIGAGIISIILIAALGGTWYYNSLDNNPSTTSISSKPKSKGNGRIKSSNNQKEKSKPSKPKKKVKQVIKKKKSKQFTDVETYRKLTTWANKRDFLNGLLGQKDVRSLHKIATSYPSKIAELYYVIANEDQYRTRKVWQGMNVAQRQEASTAAKQAVALAFYNVKDWQHGWEARYVY